jgi:hypothetical protein
MSKYVTYLGGPIRGLSYKEANEWREQVAKRLTDAGVKSLNPMRNKGLIKEVDKISDSFEDLKGYSAQDLFKRDKFDVKKSDVLLFNFLNRKVSIIGSLFELAWGDLLNKYCVVVVDNDSIYAKHPFIKGCSSITFDNLDEAVDYICTCFGD